MEAACWPRIICYRQAGAGGHACSGCSWSTHFYAGGRWRACREMGRLVRAYDGSGADAALLRTLCMSGAPQAALALAAADSTTQVQPICTGFRVCTSGALQAALALAGVDSTTQVQPQCVGSRVCTSNAPQAALALAGVDSTMQVQPQCVGSRVCTSGAPQAALAFAAADSTTQVQP